MNIFNYLSPYRNPKNEKLAREWVALGLHFNLLMAKGVPGRKLAKHQTSFLSDISHSLEKNFGSGSSAESKLVRAELLNRLAKILSLKDETKKSSLKKALVKDVKRFRGKLFRTSHEKQLLGAKMSYRTRSPMEAAYEYAPLLGSNEKQHQRTKKSIASLEIIAAEYWGHEVQLAPALKSILSGVFQFSDDEADNVIGFIYQEILPARRRANPSFATGQAREVILGSALRATTALTEEEIQEEVAVNFPTVVPSTARNTPDDWESLFD